MVELQEGLPSNNLFYEFSQFSFPINNIHFPRWNRFVLEIS